MQIVAGADSCHILSSFELTSPTTMTFPVSVLQPTSFTKRAVKCSNISILRAIHNNRNNLEIENLLLWFACVWHRRRWHYGSFYLEWHFYLRSLFSFLLWVETVYAIEYLWVAIFIKVIDIRIYKLRLNVCFCCGADSWRGLARNGNRLETSDELLDNLRLWLPLIHGNEIFTFREDGKWWPGTLSLLWGGVIIQKSFNFMSFPIKLILRDWNPFHSRLPAKLFEVNLFHENLHPRPRSFFGRRRRNFFKLFFISFTRENIEMSYWISAETE